MSRLGHLEFTAVGASSKGLPGLFLRSFAIERSPPDDFMGESDRLAIVGVIVIMDLDE